MRIHVTESLSSIPHFSGIETSFIVFCAAAHKICLSSIPHFSGIETEHCMFLLDIFFLCLSSIPHFSGIETYTIQNARKLTFYA